MNDSYSNPFSDYNANVMETKKILDYWCNPFLGSSAISEGEIYSHGNPIVFMGGRGTGKTMILRYYSYEVQRDEAIKNSQGKNSNIIPHLKRMGGIGFYIRFDGPLLRSFYGKGFSEEKWDNIFIHYFELMICKSYIEVIQDLIIKGELNREQVEKNFVPRVSKLLSKSTKKLSKIEDVLSKIEDDLYDVTQFRTKIAFSNIEFAPELYELERLSLNVAEIAQKTINEFKDSINFVIFIDEYENFSERQQLILNTLLKFVRPKITFRIGMRLEGFHTIYTTSKNEYLKEGRDYTQVIFESFLTHEKEYQNFLIQVAEKRLEKVPIFKNQNYLDIRGFLGKEEDLELEAKNLIGNRENPYKHFELLKNAPDKDLDITKVRKIIACPDKPLIEMLNILWVIRGNTPEYIRTIMNGYFANKKSEDVMKYKRDYVDKYKLSLMVLLAFEYKQHKRYYSFNTFSFLSSGIVGHFIELCRRSFQYAYFENRKQLIEEGKISPEVQDKAAKELAQTELDMVLRIYEYGDSLYKFTRNVGNIFKEYHKDPLVRYPETNQFTTILPTVGPNSIDQDKYVINAYKAAIEWSVIQKKKNIIYNLNRIYSPLFDISYRTRGGKSGEKNYQLSDLKALMFNNEVKPKMNLEKTRKIKKRDGNHSKKITDYFE